LQVQVDDDEFVHIRVFESLPHENKPLALSNYQTHKARHDELASVWLGSRQTIIPEGSSPSQIAKPLCIYGVWPLVLGLQRKERAAQIAREGRAHAG
ncbi:CYTB protein, partial [Crocuta crocuta]